MHINLYNLTIFRSDFRIHKLSKTLFSENYLVGIRDGKKERVLVSNISNVNALSLGYQ